MKLGVCTANNFASYKLIIVDLGSPGLTLVYGKTGAGKSTLSDIACWALYGKSTKGGAVDDIKSWTNEGERTIVCLDVKLTDGTTITVTRIRGRSNENDLCWREQGNDSSKTRGKDITETQALLEARLGIDYDTYIAGGYYHEFSPTGSFFASKAKERREVFEKVASLDLALLVAERASERRKEVRKQLYGISSILTELRGNVRGITNICNSLIHRSKDWERDRAKRLSSLAAKVSTFSQEEERRKASLWEAVYAIPGSLRADYWYDEQIRALEAEKSCPTCGGLSQDKVNQIKKMMNAKSRDAEQLARLERMRKEAEETRESTYAKELEVESARVNPFEAEIQSLKEKITQEEDKLQKLMFDEEKLEYEVLCLTQLYDLSFDLRGQLLKRAVKQAEESTNKYLETYFDTPMRVAFSINDSDTLDVEITKSGHVCNYKQLSKGQRQMLKLTFAVSIMDIVGNQSGIHIDNIYLDEALDGMDEDLKIMSFRLFQELATRHSSVMIIDHSLQLRTMFDRMYEVTLIGDNSHIELIHD